MPEKSPLSRHLVGPAVALALLSGATPARADPVAREKVVAALPKLEKLAEDLIAAGKVPGLAIAIVHQDEVVYLKGFGVRTVGSTVTVDADTVFQIASLAKALSATTVASLVGKGKVDWGSRLADIDPSFRLKDAYPSAQVTVRDLFNHRSGLPGEAGNDLEELGYDRAPILHRLRLVDPSSSFRAGYSYSNFGLTAGAVAAAKAAGMSWEDAAAKELYEPLGMHSTSSRHIDFVGRANRAELHVPFHGKWTALAKRQPDAQAPAGGVSSNVRDLAEWVRLELARGTYAGRRLIPEDALAATHRPLMDRGPNPITGMPGFYGLGWNLEYGRYGTVWGHAGAFSTGARSLASLLPDSRLGIVVITNAFPTGVPEGLADSFLDLVFEGRVTRDWTTPWTNLFEGLFGPAVEAAKERFGTPPASASPALPQATYLGTYSNDYVGEAAVVADAGGLVLKLGPGGVKSFALTHFDRDIFTYRPSQEAPDTPIAVRFEIGPDQKAVAVTIEDLDAFGLGTLTRGTRPK